MRPEAKARLWPLLVVLVALAAWAAGITNQFAQDDLPLIVRNLRVHDLANWREIVTSPFWPPPYSQDLYRPLTVLLLALEWAVGHGSPLVFRVVSGLLYAGASLAVLGLARALLPAGLAVGTALLFAAHPVHVEAVALGVGQNELLVGLLCCVATTHYVRRRREGAMTQRDWALLAGLYLAAALSKEHGLVLPGLLLAAELLLVRGPRPLRRLAPGYALLLGVAALVLLARVLALSGSLAGTFTADALEGQSLPGRALTMLRIVSQWLRLLLWPAHLQADYSPQEVVAASGFGLLEAAGLALLLAAAWGIWRARSRAPVASFGLLWTAIALFPVSNLLVPTGIVLAERTLFLPSVGVLLAVGGICESLARRVRSPGLRRALVPGYAALLSLAVLAGAARSAERQEAWRDEMTVRLRGVEDAPESWRTRLSYGTALFELGQPEQALMAYGRAAELAPPGRRWRVHNDLAQRFLAMGRTQAAVAELLESRAGNPGVEETWHYLVLGYLTLAEYRTAAAIADSAMAKGFPAQRFGELRALADSAERAHLPPGRIRIRINP